jgi:hypothetical protein
MMNVARVVVMLAVLAALVIVGSHAVESAVGAMKAVQSTMSKY